MTLIDVLFFVVLPYAAVGQVLPAILFYRRTDGPLLEPLGSPVLARERNTALSRAAWAGAFILLLLHVLPFLFNAAWSLLISAPWRLFLVELGGLVGGLLFVTGCASLLWHRLRDQQLSRLRTLLELATLGALLLSAIAGVVTAITARWGSAWYTHVLGPYLWSLAKLQPEAETLGALGLWPRLHLAFAFLAMALVPFTTLPRQMRTPVLALFGRVPATAGGAK